MLNTPKPQDFIGPDHVMDVRSIPCSVKHGLIVRTFAEMSVGDYFILCNGHDPMPLYHQLSAQWPDTFTWENLFKAPEEVRVKITKTAITASPRSTSTTGCHH